MDNFNSSTSLRLTVEGATVMLNSGDTILPLSRIRRIHLRGDFVELDGGRTYSYKELSEVQPTPVQWGLLEALAAQRVLNGKWKVFTAREVVECAVKLAQLWQCGQLLLWHGYPLPPPPSLPPPPQPPASLAMAGPSTAAPPLPTVPAQPEQQLQPAQEPQPHGPGSLVPLGGSGTSSGASKGEIAGGENLSDDLHRVIREIAARGRERWCENTRLWRPWSEAAALALVRAASVQGPSVVAEDAVDMEQGTDCGEGSLQSPPPLPCSLQPPAASESLALLDTTRQFVRAPPLLRESPPPPRPQSSPPPLRAQTSVPAPLPGASLHSPLRQTTPPPPPPPPPPLPNSPLPLPASPQRHRLPPPPLPPSSPPPQPPQNQAARASNSPKRDTQHAALAAVIPPHTEMYRVASSHVAVPGAAGAAAAVASQGAPPGLDTRVWGVAGEPGCAAAGTEGCEPVNGDSAAPESGTFAADCRQGTPENFAISVNAVSSDAAANSAAPLAPCASAVASPTGAPPGGDGASNCTASKPADKRSGDGRCGHDGVASGGRKRSRGHSAERKRSRSPRSRSRSRSPAGRERKAPRVSPEGRSGGRPTSEGPRHRRDEEGASRRNAAQPRSDARDGGTRARDDSLQRAGEQRERAAGEPGGRERVGLRGRDAGRREVEPRGAGTAEHRAGDARRGGESGRRGEEARAGERSRRLEEARRGDDGQSGREAARREDVRVEREARRREDRHKREEPGAKAEDRKGGGATVAAAMRDGPASPRAEAGRKPVASPAARDGGRGAGEAPCRPAPDRIGAHAGQHAQQNAGGASSGPGGEGLQAAAAVAGSGLCAEQLQLQGIGGNADAPRRSRHEDEPPSLPSQLEEGEAMPGGGEGLQGRGSTTFAAQLVGASQLALPPLPPPSLSLQAEEPGEVPVPPPPPLPPHLLRMLGVAADSPMRSMSVAESGEVVAGRRGGEEQQLLYPRPNARDGADGESCGPNAGETGRAAPWANTLASGCAAAWDEGEAGAQERSPLAPDAQALASASAAEASGTSQEVTGEGPGGSSQQLAPSQSEDSGVAQEADPSDDDDEATGDAEEEGQQQTGAAGPPDEAERAPSQPTTAAPQLAAEQPRGRSAAGDGGGGGSRKRSRSRGRKDVKAGPSGKASKPRRTSRSRSPRGGARADKRARSRSRSRGRRRSSRSRERSRERRAARRSPGGRGRGASPRAPRPEPPGLLLPPPPDPLLVPHGPGMRQSFDLRAWSLDVLSAVVRAGGKLHRNDLGSLMHVVPDEVVHTFTRGEGFSALLYSFPGLWSVDGGRFLIARGPAPASRPGPPPPHDQFWFSGPPGRPLGPLAGYPPEALRRPSPPPVGSFMRSPSRGSPLKPDEYYRPLPRPY